MANYKPYSQEWHRYRCLREALYTYLDEQIDNQVIMNDLSNILSERSERAYNEFSKINNLESMLNAK